MNIVVVVCLFVCLYTYLYNNRGYKIQLLTLHSAITQWIIALSLSLSLSLSLTAVGSAEPKKPWPTLTFCVRKTISHMDTHTHSKYNGIVLALKVLNSNTTRTAVSGWNSGSLLHIFTQDFNRENS